MIIIQSVSKSFKSLFAVQDLSLRIADNEYVALLCPNGAGKTTLVEIVEGLQRPDAGTIPLPSTGKTGGTMRSTFAG